MTRYAAGPGESPGFLLWHATLRWQREIAQALGPLELTHVQFVLLACLWWLDSQGQAPNQLTLARAAGTDVTMTSQVLRALERKGLLERRTDSRDSRAKTVHLDPAGARLARRAIEVVEEVDAAFFTRAGRSEDVVRLLTRLGPAPPSPSPSPSDANGAGVRHA